MSQYSNITADQAKALASVEPVTPPETLAFVESIIGQAAAEQQVRTTRVVVSKAAHAKQGIEYTALHLISRGFKVEVGEDGLYHTMNVSWE